MSSNANSLYSSSARSLLWTNTRIGGFRLCPPAGHCHKSRSIKEVVYIASKSEQKNPNKVAQINANGLRNITSTASYCNDKCWNQAYSMRKRVNFATSYIVPETRKDCSIMVIYLISNSMISLETITFDKWLKIVCRIRTCSSVGRCSISQPQDCKFKSCSYVTIRERKKKIDPFINSISSITTVRCWLCSFW